MFIYIVFSIHSQKGDIIDVLSMNASGVWKGFLNGRIGHFKFINVEVIPELKGGGGKVLNNKMDRTRNACPSTVDELLNRIGLREYTSVFVLNGWVFLQLSHLINYFKFSSSTATRTWNSSKSLNLPIWIIWEY